MRGTKRRAASVAAVVTGLSALAVPTPALAAGSVIDIGYTVYQSGTFKGSGSMTNNGDWDNVCVIIMGAEPGAPSWGRTIACRAGTGQHTWSAPDWKPGEGCWSVYTRITAYAGGVQKANKDSNKVVNGPDC